MAERTIADLRQKQALPLEVKILLTRERVREWITEYGEDGVYISFSGGKDSTVLLDLVRNRFGYKDVKAVFIDTGLEYPEIRQFVKTFDNVEWVKPKMNFRQVIATYGYPFISKEVSQSVWECQSARQNGKDITNYAQYKRLAGAFKGTATDKSKWSFFLDSEAPVISHKCCKIMKKDPAKSYEAKTGRRPMLGQMACESKLRTQKWLQTGCNAFDVPRPHSNPLSFWTEQDVLQYISENNLPICSVYGNVVRADSDIEGQLSIEDIGLGEMNHSYRTTGCSRTGCMFCGFGCHLDAEGSGKFELMKETHPKQYEYIMKPWDKGGLGYKEVIDWINEHGNLNIKY